MFLGSYFKRALVYVFAFKWISAHPLPVAEVVQTMAWASLLLGSLASSSPPARLINLPRHTTRLEEVKRQLDNANLRFERVQAQAPRSPQCPHPRRSFHIHICQGWSRRCFHGVSSGRGRLDHAASLSPKNELTNSHSLSPHLSLPPTHALSLSPFYVYMYIPSRQ